MEEDVLNKAKKISWLVSDIEELEENLEKFKNKERYLLALFCGEHCILTKDSHNSTTGMVLRKYRQLMIQEIEKIINNEKEEIKELLNNN